MLKIDEMYVFVAENEEGEGIMGSEMVLEGQLVMMPLVGADRARIISLIPFAENIKKVTGKDYRILRFHTKEDVTAELKNGGI
jgi:hypothetical protein